MKQITVKEMGERMKKLPPLREQTTWEVVKDYLERWKFWNWQVIRDD